MQTLVVTQAAAGDDWLHHQDYHQRLGQTQWLLRPTLAFSGLVGRE